MRVESVAAGTVILCGEASSFTEQYRAVRLARGVAGVRRVASVIEGPQLLSDAELWSDAPQARGDAAADGRLINAVKVRLVADPRVPALEVSVDAVDGEVVLFGVVPSGDAKRAAERDARSVAGVRSVRNELFVRREQGAVAIPARDSDLRAVVAAALGAVSPLDDADIVVSLRGEEVQLSGRVTSQDDRLTALLVARDAAGPHAILDALVVAPAPPAAGDQAR